MSIPPSTGAPGADAPSTSPHTNVPQSVPGVPSEGEVIAGKYRVERVLGIGGMGAVVSAIHVDLEERVAVKFLLPQAPGAQPDAVARFVREAKAAIKIRSEHVVRVLDSGKTPFGTPYIVMEYLDGRDLHAVLEEDGPLPVELAVDYLLQACDAVASAHALGIIHRDLKPGNLFLTRRGDGTPLVKVLDFGISKILSDNPASNGLTSTTAIMGTPAFMPPEQLRSTRHVDKRADIWSLGTILYAFLTGEPPYSGESTADIAAKVIRDPPPPLRTIRAEVPAGLEEAVLRCLEKEPDGRFPGVAELAEALIPFASEGSRASAARLAKQISSRQLGHAPTLRSEAPPPTSAKSGNPTRTASAWGEVKRESERPSTKRGLGFVVSIVAAAMVLGGALAVLVPHGALAPIAHSPAAEAPVAPAIAPPPPPPLTVVPPAPPVASGSPAPTPSPYAPSPTPPVASARSPQPRVSSSSSRSHAAKPGASPPPASAPPPSPAPPTSAGGLFDDRE